jgi:hypothetical protein
LLGINKRAYEIVRIQTHKDCIRVLECWMQQRVDMTELQSLSNDFDELKIRKHPTNVTFCFCERQF